MALAVRTCKVKWCSNNLKSLGFCNKHYLQMHRLGRILKRTVYDRHEIKKYGKLAKVSLYSQSGKLKGWFIIDSKNIEKVRPFKWSLDSHGYLQNHNSNPVVSLHSYILGKKRGMVIDHINHNPLDNRECNLRHLTNRENSLHRKKSGLGILWDKRLKKWRVQITSYGKVIYGGVFVKKVDAIQKAKLVRKQYA